MKIQIRMRGPQRGLQLQRTAYRWAPPEVGGHSPCYPPVTDLREGGAAPEAWGEQPKHGTREGQRKVLPWAVQLNRGVTPRSAQEEEDELAWGYTQKEKKRQIQQPQLQVHGKGSERRNKLRLQS